MRIRCGATPARRIDAGHGMLAGVHLGPQPLLEQRVAGVGEHLLAGLGVLDQHQAEVGQVELHRVDDADRDHLVPLASRVSAGSQSTSPMKSEMTNTRPRRRAVRGGQPQHRVEVGGARRPAAPVVGLVISSVRRRTWVRPVRGGITRWRRLS